MRRLLVLTVLLLGMVLGGCGLVHSRADRERRYKEAIQFQARMIVDDWDNFWLAERPSYLTEWHLRQVN